MAIEEAFDPGIEVPQVSLEGFADNISHYVKKKGNTFEVPVTVNHKKKIAAFTHTGSTETNDLYTTMALRDESSGDGLHPYEKLYIEYYEGKYSLSHRKGVLQDDGRGNLIDPAFQLEEAQGDPEIQSRNIAKINTTVDAMRLGTEVTDEAKRAYETMDGILRKLIEEENMPHKVKLWHRISNKLTKHDE